jgi:hypothetical protein
MGPKKQDFWPRINILEGKFKKNILLMNDGSSKTGQDFRNKLFSKLNLSKHLSCFLGPTIFKMPQPN